MYKNTHLSYREVHLCTITLILCGVLLYACQPVATLTAEPLNTTIPSPTPDQSAYWQAWNEGAHASAYDLGKGPNTYCARCHSPANYDPFAKVDPPPNCVSCKFAFESEPRIAVSNPMIPESEWRGTGCESCHWVKNGVAEADISWTNIQTGYHETLASSTDLCEKCHTDTETLRHQRDLQDGAHKEYTCTQCHDAHSTAASCSAANCHPEVGAEAKVIPGHDAEHANVTCVACHDATGLEVGPMEDQGAWVTFRTTELLGRTTSEAYQSHYLQLAVQCARCHYPDNPWNLNVVGGNTGP
jgi:hypothetical protein